MIAPYEHALLHDSFSPMDASILNLLQIEPLARWSDVGPVLDIAPSTAARHWDQLKEDGCAWTTVYPGDLRLALVEIDTIPTAIDSVAAALAEAPDIVTIERMAGDRDILCTVMAENLAGFSTLLQERISSHPDLRSSRAQIVTRLYLHGAEWTIRALDKPVIEAFEARGAPRRDRRLRDSATTDRGHKAWTELDRQILLELSADARLPVAALAERLDVSASTARRRLSELLRSGRLIVRTEVARGATGWPVSATLWANVDAHLLERTASIIRSIPEVRMCASVTGQDNLVFQMWLRSTEDLPRVEAVLSHSIDQLRIVDRAIALKQFKLMGRRIDATGHAVAEPVPITFRGSANSAPAPAPVGL